MSSPRSVPSRPESAPSDAMASSGTMASSEKEVSAGPYIGQRYRLRNIKKGVMKRKVPTDVAKRAIELYDFEKDFDEQPPELMDELERMLGMEGFKWPTADCRLIMISEKLER